MFRIQVNKLRWVINFFVIVRAGGSFAGRAGNLTVVEGHDALLWCPAGSYSLPAITWTKEGQAIKPGKRYSHRHMLLPVPYVYTPT